MSNNNDTCCFSDILRVIDVLQRNVERIEDIDDSCSKPFLGNCGPKSCFNTRPVTFYTCNGNLLTLNYQADNGTATSSVFRVEKVDGCCVTVLILARNCDKDDPNRDFVSTGQFATINLRCACVLKCLPDTIVDCL